MRASVDDIQGRVASITDLDEDTSAITSDDYSLRLKYINMAQREWAEIYDWQTLYSEYNVVISTSTGNASVVLPDNFRKLAGYPLITYDGSTTEKFSDVKPQDDNQYRDTDKRVWMLGSPSGGYIMRVFGATLVSGASTKVPYFRSPVSLVSPANIPDCNNTDYLVQRTIAFIWEAAEDARFPQAKAQSEKILQNLIEYENVFGRGADWDHVKSVEQTRYSFRLGRD